MSKHKYIITMRGPSSEYESPNPVTLLRLSGETTSFAKEITKLTKWKGPTEDSCTGYVFDSQLHPSVPCCRTYNLMAPFPPKVFIPLTSRLSSTAPRSSTPATHSIPGPSHPAPSALPSFRLPQRPCSGSGRGREEARRTGALFSALIQALLSFPSQLPHLIISFAESWNYKKLQRLICFICTC